MQEEILTIIRNPPNFAIKSQLIYLNNWAYSNYCYPTSFDKAREVLINYLELMYKINPVHTDVLDVIRSNWKQTDFSATYPRDIMISILQNNGELKQI